MRKLMDILFETEEEIVVDEPMRNVEKQAPVVKTTEKVEDNRKNIQKLDVLERKVRNKSFGIIDVEELQVKKPILSKAPINDSKPYEAQPPISPIFGFLKDDEEKVLTTPQITSSTNTTSRLGTVLSPIYGITNTNNEVKSEVKVEEKHEEPFDMPIIGEDIIRIPYPTNEEVSVFGNTEEVNLVQEENEEESITTFETIDEFDESDSNEFMNVSLSDMLHHSDNTFVAEQEISLFDEFEEK